MPRTSRKSSPEPKAAAPSEPSAFRSTTQADLKCHEPAFLVGLYRDMMRTRALDTRIEALESRRLETRHREARRRRQQHEVAGLQCQRALTVDRQAAAALQYRAEARLTERRVTDAPRAGTADPPREHRSRLKKGDHFGERIDHLWTFANVIRTLHGR